MIYVIVCEEETKEWAGYWIAEPVKGFRCRFDSIMKKNHFIFFYENTTEWVFLLVHITVKEQAGEELCLTILDDFFDAMKKDGLPGLTWVPQEPQASNAFSHPWKIP